MALHVAALLIGFAFDLAAGDPGFLWHPVRGIGWIIEKIEKFLRRQMGNLPADAEDRREQQMGLVLTVTVLGVTGLSAAGILSVARLLHPGLHFLIQIIMSWQALALKSLKTESMKVFHALKGGDRESARSAVAMIVGRDTAGLSETQIVRAAIETVAENTSDGVIAPFLYLLIGGPVLGFLYKAVNTMDSMVGYQNEQYRYFGKVAARLDDAVNYLPARISAILMILAAWILKYDANSAVRIFYRDRRRHKSPNSAQTESVCAGALGIQLGGQASYFGAAWNKPTIGDALREATYEDIRRANRLLYGTALLLAGMTTGGYIWFLMNMAEIFTAIR